MVLGIATGLLGLGLALPTGLAFGYGYGYGVRQGYSAFKPPSKTAQGLKMSPDPVQGGLGMGLQTAEERTKVKTPTPPLSTGPSLQSQGPALLGTPSGTAGTTRPDTISSKSGRFTITRSQKKKHPYNDRDYYKKWYNEQHPFQKQRKPYYQTGKYRYN